MNIVRRFSQYQYRWISLVFLTLGLAIVIIDNSVLNVAIPYILRDLHTSFTNIQWVVSGYALLIATFLITIGRIGDIVGRKKIFIFGSILFAIGSFFASISKDVILLFYGEAFIEAIGAAMMLTSSLSLLVTTFKGKERAVAFGIWGSVAGTSATIGPLLGGYFTTYHTWRWSLRINVFVAIIAILGSVFIKESKGLGNKTVDWLGTIFSGLGFFSLVFSLIEGEKYGWIKPTAPFSLFGYQWPLSTLSVIPITFIISIIFLTCFALQEFYLEKRGGSPLIKPSLFINRGFSLGLTALGIVSLGQFGIFFVMPIYLQDVLHFTAFNTGIVFLPSSLSIAIFGPLSGYIASRIGPKWVTAVGMIILATGSFLLDHSLYNHSSLFSLAPGFILFGAGIGIASAQLTNIILSSVPQEYAGEASASSNTIRQIGASVGTAIIGAVLTSTLLTHIAMTITVDQNLPHQEKKGLIQNASQVNVESGQNFTSQSTNQSIIHFVSSDLQYSLVHAAQDAILLAFFFISIGAIVSLFIPNSNVFSEQIKETTSLSDTEELPKVQDSQATLLSENSPQYMDKPIRRN